MIGSLLDLVVQELNSVICRRLGINPATSQKVALSPIIESDGSLAVKDKNLLLFKLINIEMDPVANGPQPTAGFPGNGSSLIKASPIYLNLKVILAAHFKPEQIKEGLDILTMGIAHFQGKPAWNAQNTPGFPESVNKLLFEMETIDLNQLGHLWGAIGVKYMPSVLYKVKMITIDDSTIKEFIPSVIELSTTVNTSE